MMAAFIETVLIGVSVRLRVLLLGLLAIACSRLLTADERREPSGTGASHAVVSEGAACDTAAQCASGVCEGRGCGAQEKGVCVSQNRACTRDLRSYCGCDGQTFQSSGSCPGRRYAHEGECP
jgi:hypothetical protein